MAQINIDIISVGAPTFVKTARGGYNYLEVAYRKDGKIEGKKIMDFANKEIFNSLKNNVKPGDSLQVTLEKDKNDFWQWQGFQVVGSGGNVSAPESGGAAVAPTSGVPAPNKTVGRVTGSNYETSEERAVRQRLIVRQSSLTAALTFLTHNLPKAQFATNELFALADEITDWVFKTNPVKELQEMKDDLPA